jgi:hypothetical protein
MLLKKLLITLITFSLCFLLLADFCSAMDDLYMTRNLKNFYDANLNVMPSLIKKHMQEPEGGYSSSVINGLLKSQPPSLQKLDKTKSEDKLFYRAMFVGMVLSQISKDKVFTENLLQEFELNQKHLETLQIIFPTVDERQEENLDLRVNYQKSHPLSAKKYQQLKETLNLDASDLLLFNRVHVAKSLLNIQRDNPALKAELMPILTNLRDTQPRIKTADDFLVDVCVLDILNSGGWKLAPALQAFITNNDLAFSSVLSLAVAADSTRVIDTLIRRGEGISKQSLKELLNIKILRTAISYGSSNSLIYLLKVYDKYRWDFDHTELINFAINNLQLDIVKYLHGQQATQAHYTSVILLENAMEEGFGIDAVEAESLRAKMLQGASGKDRCISKFLRRLFR